MDTPGTAPVLCWQCVGNARGLPACLPQSACHVSGPSSPATEGRVGGWLAALHHGRSPPPPALPCPHLGHEAGVGTLVDLWDRLKAPHRSHVHIARDKREAQAARLQAEQEQERERERRIRQ